MLIRSEPKSLRLQANLPFQSQGTYPPCVVYPYENIFMYVSSFAGDYNAKYYHMCPLARD